MSELMDEAATRAGGPRPRPADAPDDTPHPSGADVGWGITGTLLAGLVVYGGAGLLVDRWLDTKVFALIGVVVGLGLSVYLITVKYGGPVQQTQAISSTSYSKISSKSYSTYRNTPGGRRSQPRTQKGHR